MSVEILGKVDRKLEEVKRALEVYDAQHPAAIRLYRQNSASIRVRIVDPKFHGISKGDRHDRVWSYLEGLPEQTLRDISVLLLLTPEETRTSLMNLEFEDPTPSRL